MIPSVTWKRGCWLYCIKTVAHILFYIRIEKQLGQLSQPPAAFLCRQLVHLPSADVKYSPLTWPEWKPAGVWIQGTWVKTDCTANTQEAGVNPSVRLAALWSTTATSTLQKKNVLSRFMHECVSMPRAVHHGLCTREGTLDGPDAAGEQHQCRTFTSLTALRRSVGEYLMCHLFYCCPAHTPDKLGWDCFIVFDR